MPDRHRTRRRTIRPEAPELIDLAQGLRDLETLTNRARARVDDLLTGLLDGWKTRYPTDYGWKFTDPALEVFDMFGCNDAGAQPKMESAARALFARGFALVRFHDHDHRRAITCTCREHAL